MLRRTFVLLMVGMLAAPLAEAADPPTRDKPLEVGDEAPALVMKTPGDQEVDLAKVFDGATTVLVMLRGFPGYQCPICSRQVAGYRAAAEELEKAGVHVVLVYPGEVGNLAERSLEFRGDKPLPEPLAFVIDPMFRLTKAYGLRWDETRETAYPATYIIGPDRKVTFAKVSRSHGGRVEAKAVLRELAKQP